jgi:hypothetical protein
MTYGKALALGLLWTKDGVAVPPYRDPAGRSTTCSSTSYFSAPPVGGNCGTELGPRVSRGRGFHPLSFWLLVPEKARPKET